MVARAVAVVSEPAMTSTLACAINHSSDLLSDLSASNRAKKSSRVIVSLRATRARTRSREYLRNRSNFFLILAGRANRRTGHKSGSRRPISNKQTRMPASWMVSIQKCDLADGVSWPVGRQKRKIFLFLTRFDSSKRFREGKFANDIKTQIIEPLSLIRSNLKWKNAGNRELLLLLACLEPFRCRASSAEIQTGLYYHG